MKLKSLNTEAKRCIKNNFGKLFFITFLNAFISVAFTRVSENFETSIFKIIFLIFSYLITIPLSYGVIVSYMKSSNNESFSIFDFVSDGMKSFKRVWAVFGRTVLKLILPLVVLIIGYIVAIFLFSFAVFNAFTNGGSSGTLEIIISAALIIAVTIFYIIKALSYSLTSYILYDNPEFSAKQVVEESALMMKGNKMLLVAISFYVTLIYVLLFGTCFLIMTLISNYIGILMSVVLVLMASIPLLPYSMGLQLAFYNLLKKGNTSSSNDDVIQDYDN